MPTSETTAQKGQQTTETVTLSVPGTEGQKPPETPGKPDEGQEGTETGQEPPADAETFPRAYVERLRRESAGHRDKAKRTDEYASALWEARVAASGRLADPTDLPMPEGTDPLDAEAVTAAVEDLLSRKPHLASRVPRGDVGQGASKTEEPFSLGALIRSRA